MKELTLVVQSREETGKNANRKLRGQGVVPAVVYGAGRPTVTIQIDKRSILDLLRNEESGGNPIFLLQLEGTGKSRHAMIRDMQVDPVSRKIVHIDFQRLLLDEVIQVGVPVVIEGLALGVKNEGGFIDFVTREIEVECLPTQIPSSIVVDVSGLHLNQHVGAGEVELPEGVKLKSDPHSVIVAVAGRQLEEEEAAEGEEELLEAAAPEPEVIGRGGDEESTEG